MRALKPAAEMSTDERRIENGSARTTLSAVTATPLAKLSVYAPAVVSRTAVSMWPRLIDAWPIAPARPSTIWSLPPRTWYFSFDGPKIRSWP